MLVKEAKAVAHQWVQEEGSKLPGFVGAFYHGSTNWLPADVILPATSDLDIMLVFEDEVPAAKLGKFRYRDVLLEVSYLPQAQVQSPEQVLGNYHLAGSFRQPGIIADPSGRLTELQAAVAAAYANRRWVDQRGQHARNNGLQYLHQLHAAEIFHDQVMSWLFAAGATTHILLVAGLKNPTVRQRYGAVRELLAAYQRSGFYPTLLDLLGCAQMIQRRATAHLVALSAAFDAATAVIQSPFFFAADITQNARPVAIDGSRKLIERGDHREAIFWMVATYSRCQQVFYQDAPVAMQEHFNSGYRQLLGDLGIASTADLYARGEQIKASLPHVWTVAEAIIAANPEISD